MGGGGIDYGISLKCREGGRVGKDKISEAPLKHWVAITDGGIISKKEESNGSDNNISNSRSSPFGIALERTKRSLGWSNLRNYSGNYHGSCY